MINGGRGASPQYRSKAANDQPCLASASPSVPRQTQTPRKAAASHGKQLAGTDSEVGFMAVVANADKRAGCTCRRHHATRGRPRTCLRGAGSTAVRQHRPFARLARCHADCRLVASATCRRPRGEARRGLFEHRLRATCSAASLPRPGQQLNLPHASSHASLDRCLLYLLRAREPIPKHVLHVMTPAPPPSRVVAAGGVRR